MPLFLCSPEPMGELNLSNCSKNEPGHPPSLIRVFTVCMTKAWVLNYPLSAQWRLWSDWADAQPDLRLRWAHMPFSCFCHEEAQMSNSIHPQLYDIWQNQQNVMCTQQKLRSAWASAQSDQSLHCALNGYIATDLRFLCVDSKGDQTGWMPRLICLCWAHRSFC